MAFIELKNVSYSYRPEDGRVLDGITFSVEKGSYTAILGHNGSGKSTLAKIICGLYLPTEGSVTVNIDGREDRLYPGDLVLFRSRGVHSMRTENCPLNRYYTLKLRPKLLYNISPKDSLGKVALRFSVFNSELKYIWRKNELEGTDILKGYRELMEKWTGEGDLNDISMLISVITVILGVLRDDGESFDNLSLDANSIYDGITYIHNNFAEDITAEQVAERVNMSYSFFARSFKAATGKTFKEYLNITRMNEAEQLLVNTDLPISEVAIRCGYNSIAYFTSLYKQYKGNTPRSERK